MAEQQFNVDEAREIIESGIAQAQEILSDPEKINDLLKQLEQKVKELPSSMGEALGNIPLMAQMVKGYVTQEYTDVSPKVVASLVSAFVYVVAKKDVVPDTVPVLGLVDDVAVVALAMKINEAELDAFKQWQDAHLVDDTAPTEA